MIFDLGFVSLFPSVAFQGLVDQVWIDGSGNDFIISPSFADWANCRRIFTISKASGLLTTTTNNNKSRQRQTLWRGLECPLWTLWSACIRYNKPTLKLPAETRGNESFNSCMQICIQKEDNTIWSWILCEWRGNKAFTKTYPLFTWSPRPWTFQVSQRLRTSTFAFHPSVF